MSCSQCSSTGTAHSVGTPPICCSSLDGKGLRVLVIMEKCRGGRGQMQRGEALDGNNARSQCHWLHSYTVTHHVIPLPRRLPPAISASSCCSSQCHRLHSYTITHHAIPLHCRLPPAISASSCCSSCRICHQKWGVTTTRTRPSSRSWPTS
jgi:hypothetical protein